MTGDMLMLEVCEKYHWDYYQYLAQPAWLIDLIVKKMEIDNQKEAARAKQKNG